MFTAPGVLYLVSQFASRCQFLGVSFFDRPRPRQQHPSAGMSLWRPVALCQVPPQAPGRRSSPRGIRPQAQFLLRARRLPQAGDAAVGAVPRPKGLPCCRGRPGRSHAARALAAAGPGTFGTLRRRPPNHRSLAGLLARALSADAVLESRTRSLASGGGHDRPSAITLGRVSRPGSIERRLEPAAAVSLAHHDHRGPGDRAFALIPAHPQKTLLDGPRGPGYPRV
jgi:hypothetical protein